MRHGGGVTIPLPSRNDDDNDNDMNNNNNNYHGTTNFRERRITVESVFNSISRVLILNLATIYVNHVSVLCNRRIHFLTRIIEI